MLFFYTIHAQAAQVQVSLAWDPSPSPNVAGYQLFYGQATGSYSANVNVGNQTSYTLTGLQDGVPYYFAVKAYDTSTPPTESSFSNEVCQPCASSTAPVADFSASPLTGMAPLTVTFINNSTGTVTGTIWSWDFGDGSPISHDQNPTSHIYASSGTYTVSLIATDSAGSDTKTRTGYIIVSSSGSLRTGRRHR